MINQTSIFPEELKNRIISANNVVIATHFNADGDAIGSTASLAGILKKMGKKVSSFTPNNYPGFLKWIPGSEEIMIYKYHESRIRDHVSKADIVICVDFNDIDRLDNAAGLITSSGKYIILLDHHPDPRSFFSINATLTHLGSTAELVYLLIKELGWENEIDTGIAEAIYAGILTDTGNFSFSCSYPEVWENVAELLRYNIDRDAISAKIYDNYSEDRMRLMGYCLKDKMQVLPEFNTAFISLSLDELNRHHHQKGDTEGFVNLPFAIKGIRFTALFIEKEDHVKISFRSRGAFPANLFSEKHFRGGGHLNAAGGEWDKPLADAVERFKGLLEDYREELSG